MKKIILPADYAIVLQHVNRSGEQDISALAESLRFDKKRLAHIIQSLHHKGLIYFNNRYQHRWIRLSSKGRQIALRILPEQGYCVGTA